MKYAILTAIFVAILFPVASKSALGPEAHPSCHCKAKWNHKAYVYKVVWVASDGTKIHAKCRVNPRTGNTWCWLV